MRKLLRVLGLLTCLSPFAAARVQAPDSSAAPAAHATGELLGATFAKQPGWKLEKPTELFEIERVVDGDTLHIRRNGELQKLRLLSVDTEEKFSTNTGDASKPSTVFGEECAQWAMEYFKPSAERPDAGRIGLKFPRDVEEHDVYGRVLCYVILPDGRNFDLLLVELGKSPYFNKYGNSEVCHEALVAAQARARAAKRGIWNPETNKPRNPGDATVERPYERLMPWWDARAAAVDAYRKRREETPELVASSDAPAELARAFKTCAKGAEVEIFGQIERLFEEQDGSQTVLLRTGAKDDAVRVKIAKADRPKFAALDFEHRNEEGRQNYLWVRGLLARGARGYEFTCADPKAWRVAGPEPAKAKGG